MSELAHTNVPVPAGSSQGITVRRVRFVPQAGPAGKVRREFHKPRSCVAVEESLPLSDLPVTKIWPEPFDSLVVLCFSQKPSAEWQRFIGDWLKPPELSESPRPILIEGKGQKVQWRPGRAVIEVKEVNQEEVLAALTDFAFFEGELRDLEAALRMREADVHTDVRRAYHIRYSDRRHWPRFTEMIQCFSGMRLTYAQLERWLVRGARTLPDASRGWYARLLGKAHVEPRIEEFSNRLEACEDLYEGANDRVTDYLGYFYGHVLEVIIVVFLFAEVCIGIAELYLHFLDHYSGE